MENYTTSPPSVQRWRLPDVNARDAAIVCNIALQFGAPAEVIRKALCRDSQGRANGSLGVALNLIADEGGGR